MIEPSIRDIEREAFFLELAPHLSISARVATREATSVAGMGAWPAAGHAALPGVVDRAVARRTTAAIEALVARGLHPIFAYVYDELWTPVRAVLPIAERVMGPCRVLSDGWAWRVPPGSRGWPPHRDSGDRVRGPGGGPVLLNVWIALTDVGADQSAVHVVPLDRDPAWAEGRLGDCSVVDGSGLPLLAAAGTALVWDATMLHWGGPSDAGAEGPRISSSYTIAADVPSNARRESVDLDSFGFRARLDAIARMIVTYRRYERMPRAIEAWAHALVGLARSR